MISSIRHILILQIVTAQVLYDKTFTSSQDHQILNFIPPGYDLQENLIIYISLTQIDVNNYAEMSVCMQNNCIKDQNSIDFKQSIQYVRIMINAGSPALQQFYNALPYSKTDYSIQITSQSSSFQVKAEVIDGTICYQPCQNSNECQNGKCQCAMGYSSLDCSIILNDILAADTMNTTSLYYFNYLDQEIELDYLMQFSNESEVSYSCSSSKPHLLEYDYMLKQTYLNISSQILQQCFQFYNQETGLQEYQSFIIIRLLSPDTIQLINQTALPAASLSMLAIIFGCVGGFILIISGYCLNKCRQEARQRSQIAQQYQIQEQQMEISLPKFIYSDMINKYPGLKDDNECLICLIQFEPDDEVRLTSCTHIFHLKCIGFWLEKNKTCPMCREALDVQPPANIFQMEIAELKSQSKSIHKNEEQLQFHKITNRLLGTIQEFAQPIQIVQGNGKTEQIEVIEQQFAPKENESPIAKDLNK